MSSNETNEANDLQLVQMRLLPMTVEKAARLQEHLGVSTRTQAVKTAIELALIVADALTSGKRVYIEDRDGQKEIVVPGLSPVE